MGTIFTLGTAGHIDHGKTTLVRALTGIDTDRLPEEKARGISIDLGFAHYTTPGGRRVGIVDVPGHERFIKNMVAGAWGIRAHLLVIAADEGIKPQTREHRDILELLGVTRGIVALTKSDAVGADRLAATHAEVEEWMQGSPFAGAPILPTAAADPASIARLGTAIDELLGALPDPGVAGLFRLPVDRVFTLKGHGTVVTGTVASGTLSAGASVELLPAGLKSRVRGLQAFEQAVDEVRAGQRAALNLPDVGPDQVRRGDVCAAAGFFKPSYLLDGRLRLLRGLPRSASPLKSGTRVRLYTGTREVIGRVHLLEGRELKEGEAALAQFRLEEPVAAARGDHYLLRLYSPVVTVGGGELLDPAPSKHRKAAGAARQLLQLERASPDELVIQTLETGRALFHTAGTMAVALALPEAEITPALGAAAAAGALSRAGGHYCHSGRLERELARLIEALEAFHKAQPMLFGTDKASLAHGTFPQLDAGAFDLLLSLAAARGGVETGGSAVRRAGWKPHAGDKLEPAVRIVEARLAAAPELFVNLRELETELKLMRHEFALLVKFLQSSGLAMKVGPEFLIGRANYDRLLKQILAVLRKTGRASTPQFKEGLGLSRKYLIPLLEHLDETGVTVRSGNDRVLRKSLDGRG